MRELVGPKGIIFMLATALVAGCGGSDGGGGSSGGGVVTLPPATPPATPPPSPPPPPPPPPTSSSPTDWASVAAFYDSAPDIAGCRAGTLKAGVKSEMLANVNALRALHGLAPVEYSFADDAQVAEASLMMAANGALSHNPPTSWSCYTSTGATGAGTSNLIGGRGNGLIFFRPDDHLALWLNEGGTSSLGHRRWILDPFLGKISYGRVTVQRADGFRIDGSALKVFSFTGGRPAPSVVPQYIALPQGDYPVRYFRPTDYLSFSIAPSATSSGAAASVSFASASISVMNGSTAMAVSDVSFDNAGYGLANNLQWRVAGLQSGVTYTVRITGVAGAPATSYTYNFRIVN